MRNRNEKNEVHIYKVRLVAQCFSQHPGLTTPVMEIKLMDVVIAYHYEYLDAEIHESALWTSLPN